MKQDVYDQGAGTTSTARRPGSETKTGAPSEAEKQEMMRKMEEAGRPGPGHKALEPLVGNWRCEVKCWHDPAGQAQTSQGRATAKWTMNGRFLEEEFHGEMMGKPFEGCYFMGFDNTKQTFQSVWVNDLGTSMFISEGRGENGNKVITQEGKSSCAATGRTDVPMRTVLRVLNNDKHTFEMFDGSKGNAKVMEITYTRQ